VDIKKVVIWAKVRLRKYLNSNPYPIALSGDNLDSFMLEIAD